MAKHQNMMVETTVAMNKAVVFIEAIWIGLEDE